MPESKPNLGLDTGPKAPTGPTLFLQRQPYRRRRLIDAARVLPVFGSFLLLVPALLIPQDVAGSTSSMWLFLFGVWIVMILSGSMIVRYMVDADDRDIKGSEDQEAQD